MRGADTCPHFACVSAARRWFAAACAFPNRSHAAATRRRNAQCPHFAFVISAPPFNRTIPYHAGGEMQGTSANILSAEAGRRLGAGEVANAALAQRFRRWTRARLPDRPQSPRKLQPQTLIVRRTHRVAPQLLGDPLHFRRVQTTRTHPMGDQPRPRGTLDPAQGAARVPIRQVVTLNPDPRVPARECS